MALLNIEGFETRSAKEGWAYTSSQFVAGRFGGTGIAIGSYQYALPTPTDVVIVGLAYQMPSAPSNRSIVEFYDAASGNTQCKLALRGDRYVEAQRTGVTMAASSGPIAASGEWCYIEVKCRLNDVTGFLEARVNGSVVMSYTGDTIQTTASGLNTGVTSLWFQGGSGQVIDDVYVLDNTGPAPYNTYLGEISVETLTPNGNGATNQFVGSDGNSVDNYLLVDEMPAVNTDYAASSTVGQRDLYTFTDPTVGIGEILAVQTAMAVDKTLPGPAPIKTVERLASGVERVSAAKTTSNLVYKTTLSTLDPTGAAWTPTSVAGMQAGVEVA